jgi:hypothetical protein
MEVRNCVESAEQKDAWEMDGWPARLKAGHVDAQISLPYLLLSIRSLNRPAEPFLSLVASLRSFGCQASKENAPS